MNLHYDLLNLKAKVDAGAAYVVTQMFFDNNKYFDFVRSARQAGITVPIIPGIKPLTSLRQLSLLPRTFHIDIPTELSDNLLRCKSNEEVRELGVEWASVRLANSVRPVCRAYTSIRCTPLQAWLGLQKPSIEH